MADYPYTTVTGKIMPILSKIREVGVPPKATVQWLKSVGFTSSNDASLLTVMRFIGFIDTSGVPTEAWKKYRGAQHGQVLANAIRQGYSDLFSVYPDANNRTATEIQDVISTTSNAGKQAITKTVRTFTNLCAEGDFTAAGEVAPPSPPRADANAGVPGTGGAPFTPFSSGSPSLHIDIQVHISPDSTPDQIDKIFESMAKHLYKQKK